MSEEYKNSESWYAPLKREEAAPAKEKKKKSLPVGWRIALGALLLFGLIAGSSMLFSNAGSETGGGDGGSIQIPAPGDQMPEDPKDFFENYYTAPGGGKAEYHLAKEEEQFDFQIELIPAKDGEKSLQEIYADCADSIVAITGYVDGKTGYYWGTGIVMSADGLILTNAHVVEKCDRATVTVSDNSSYEARLVGADAASDVAVLKIDAEGLKPAVFGDSNALSVGEKVAAIGNPLGEDLRATLTDGIISAIDRGVNFNGNSMNLLQTNTAINEGNSGGPLFNMYGQVIGITNMKMMSSYSSIEGIGFAIPSSTVARIVNALVEKGEVSGRTSIGITVGSIPDEARERYGDKLPESGGLYISDVAEGSDALKKGLRRGDILLKADGVESAPRRSCRA